MGEDKFVRFEKRVISLITTRVVNMDSFTRDDLMAHLNYFIEKYPDCITVNSKDEIIDAIVNEIKKIKEFRKLTEDMAAYLGSSHQ